MADRIKEINRTRLVIMFNEEMCVKQTFYWHAQTPGQNYRFSDETWYDLKYTCEALVTYHSRLFPENLFTYNVSETNIMLTSWSFEPLKILLPRELNTKAVYKVAASSPPDFLLIAAVLLILLEVTSGQIVPNTVKDKAFWSRGSKLLTTADPYFYQRRLQSTRRKHNFGFNLSQLEIQALQVLLTEEKSNSKDAEPRFRFLPKVVLHRQGYNEDAWQELIYDPRITEIDPAKAAEHCGNLIRQMQVMYEEEYRSPDYKDSLSKKSSFYTMSPEDQARCLYLYATTVATSSVIALSLDTVINYTLTLTAFKQAGHPVFTTFKSKEEKQPDSATYISLDMRHIDAKRHGIFENR